MSIQTEEKENIKLNEAIDKLTEEILNLQDEEKACKDRLYEISQELVANDFKWYQIRDKKAHHKSLELEREKLERESFERIKKINSLKRKKRFLSRRKLIKKSNILNGKNVIIGVAIIVLIIAFISVIASSNSNKNEVKDPSIIQQFNLTINVENQSNTLESQYDDVDVYIDQFRLGTISSGSIKTFNVKIDKGVHSFICKNSENESVKGDYKLKITDDSNYQFSVLCYDDKIEINSMTYKESTTKTETLKETTTESTTIMESTTTTENTTTTESTTLESTTKKETTTKKQTTNKPTTKKKTNTRTVYRTPSGECYHSNSSCGGKNSYAITMDEASGLRPCKKCT